MEELENLKILFLQNFLSFINNFTIYIIFSVLLAMYFVFKKGREIGQDDYYKIREQKNKEFIKKTNFEKIKKKNQEKKNDVDFSTLFGIKLLIKEDVNFLFDYYKKDMPIIDYDYHEKKLRNYFRDNRERISKNFKDVLFERIENLNSQTEVEIEIFYLHFLAVIFPFGIEYDLKGNILIDKKIVTKKLVELYFRKYSFDVENYLFLFIEQINREVLNISLYLKLKQLFSRMISDENIGMIMKAKIPVEIFCFSTLVVDIKKHKLVNNYRANHKPTNLTIDAQGNFTTPEYEKEKATLDAIEKQHKNYKEINKQKINGENIQEESSDDINSSEDSQQDLSMADIENYDSAFLDGSSKINLPLLNNVNSSNKNAPENDSDFSEEPDKNHLDSEEDKSSQEQEDESMQNSDIDSAKNDLNEEVIPEQASDDLEESEQEEESEKEPIVQTVVEPVKEEIQNKPKKQIVKKEFVSLEKHFKQILHNLKSISAKKSPYIFADDKNVYISIYLFFYVINKNFNKIEKELDCKNNLSRYISNVSQFLGEAQGKKRTLTQNIILDKKITMFFLFDRKKLIEINSGFENIVDKETIFKIFFDEKIVKKDTARIEYKEFEKNMKEKYE